MLIVVSATLSGHASARRLPSRELPVRRVRLSRAWERRVVDEPVSEVADALGYASVNVLVALFRRHFGHPAARYCAQRPARA